ncbi:MAG TPA: dolichyl-phosphate beta-glucosyltransferase [Verrucomicrobiae bacterium]|nr:dolichyl-phosphate beta-glucosyltransferase [Verrucomicrobiae bacterium]
MSPLFFPEVAVVSEIWYADRMPHISIVIPAYNEADRLPETLALVRDYLEQQSFEAEVLVVDDGSTDDTVKKVQEMQERFPQLKLIANEKNKGKGGVVRQGMLAAQGDYRLFMDADYATPITELDKFLPYLGQFDIIIGSRYLNGGSIRVKQPLQRRIVSRIGNLLIQQSLLRGIVDTQCGFKLFTAAAAERVFKKQSMDGWVFDVEVLSIARQLGLTIKEISVDWYDAKQSKLRAVHAAAKSYSDLKVVKKKIREGAYLD